MKTYPMLHKVVLKQWISWSQAHGRLLNFARHNTTSFQGCFLPFQRVKSFQNSLNLRSGTKIFEKIVFKILKIWIWHFNRTCQSKPLCERQLFSIYIFQSSEISSKTTSICHRFTFEFMETKSEACSWKAFTSKA